MEPRFQQHAVGDQSCSDVPATQTTCPSVFENTTNSQGTPASYGEAYDNEHPQGDQIRRQAEYYFSDENLVHDAHLLAKTGGNGNGLVSISHICGFGKMRKYKPYASVVGSLKRSTFLDVHEDKYVKRRYPLTKPLLVQPKIAVARRHITQVMEDKPWLTKNMVKPTGFETYFADAPITPETFKEEQHLYDPELCFTTRVETAIQRYTAKRKMHQSTLQIFMKWMNFGGISCAQRQFTGGLDDEFLQDRDATEIAALTATYHVMTDVDDEEKYSTDFEGIAKGFLSSPAWCDWDTKDKVKSCTNILRNFYNYLLYHDVCPEYVDQILEAGKVCDLADSELPRLCQISRQLPGDFNTACSTLHKGNFAGLYAGENDWDAAEVGWSMADAKMITMAGIVAHGTEAQYEQALAAVATGFQVVSEESLGLEVVAIELAGDEVTKYYQEGRLQDTFLRTLGKLRCKRWTPPFEPQDDLPLTIVKQRTTQDFVLWVEEDILKYCVMGMKMEATVKELDLGVWWIDSIQGTYSSFFTYLPNERIRLWKEPGPPKAWMRRHEGAQGDHQDGTTAWAGDKDDVC